jgi:hypothetical protein
MAPVRNYVSEEHIAPIIGVTRVGDLGAMLAVTNNRNTLLVIKKNTETLIDASKEGGLKVNVEKTKYMSVSHDQNAGQNLEIKLANRYFKNVSQFKYL